MIDDVDVSTGILIPVYDNRAAIGEVVSRAVATDLPVLVVDDGSTDGTTGELDRCHGIHSRVRHPENRGKGAALRTGFELGRRLGLRFLVTVDGDGQHHPEEIPRLLHRLRNDRDPDSLLIIGARATMGDDGNVPRRCLLGRRMSNGFCRLLTGRVLRDTQSGFRLYPLGPLRSMPLSGRHYDLEFELLVRWLRSGRRIAEVDVEVTYPPVGERVSHFRPLWDVLRILRRGLGLGFRGSRPARKKERRISERPRAGEARVP